MTTFSNNLEKKDRFEKGLFFYIFYLSFGSSEGVFFSFFFVLRSLTVACLDTVGNVLESSDSFATWVSVGTISSEQSNKRAVGIGSRSEILQAFFFKRAETAVSLTALKWVSCFPEKKKRKKKTQKKTPTQPDQQNWREQL